MLEILFAILFFACDQISKLIITQYLNLYESIPVIKNFFNISYIHNSGIAFGLFHGYNKIILIILLFLFLTVIFSMRKDLKSIYFANKNKLFFRINLALFFGGAFGNLVDRIFRGYVVDFLDFRVWPVFNLADTFVCVSCFLFAIYFLKNRKEYVSDTV